MSEQQIDRKTTELVKKDEIEIDMVEVLRRIIAIRKKLYKAAGVGLIIGIIVVVSIPKQYTVQVTLSPEMGGSKGSSGLAGMAASFLGSGIPTGDNPDALNASLSSDIVSSTPFMLELLKMNVSSPKMGTVTLEKYLDEHASPWWEYVIGLPGEVINGAKSLFVTEINGETVALQNGSTIELTKNEATKVGLLKKNIVVSMDKKTAITQVSITLQNPKIAAFVADSVVHVLQEYIIKYRTSKAKEDCIYLEKLFRERQQEYYAVQKKYANYVDSHDNLILQSVRAEQERLQNDMSLAYQMYSQVANQLQVARAKVQEVKPVFAVVEPAVVPLNSSGASSKILILLFVFLSLICSIGWIMIGKGFWNKLINEVKNK